MHSRLKYRSILLMAILSAGANLSTQAQLATPFQNMESVTYAIKYNWGLIWLEAGEVTFSVSKENYGSQETWKFSGVGRTYPKYDWFYKVRDYYYSNVSVDGFQPVHFEREVNEGNTHFIYKYDFFPEANKVAVVQKFENKPEESLIIPYDSGGYDALAMIYYARQIDFEKYQAGDHIPLKLFLDKKNYPSYLEYLGKKTIEIEDKGFVNCIVFKPLLIEGTIFKGGDEMTVYVTDDQNKVPVYIETPIIVGKIKAILKSTTHLRSRILWQNE